ncbi:MAG: aldehyde dehydrogenase family protein [Chitinophagaceae bacterium]
MATSTLRLEVLKTYKLYIGGQFPRTESGRYYSPVNAQGKKIANVCLASRKDLRDAIGAARTALGGWSNRSAFNRGQILYRMAEMLEGRKNQFMNELLQEGFSKAAATKELTLSVDRLLHYAGWCDKYQALFSSVNPVASSHFNFSVPEPMGVIGMIAPQNSSLLGLVSMMAPCIAGGNTCVIIASHKSPLSAISFAEVLNSADLPGGVVNILTGKPAELISWLGNHLDVNAVVLGDTDNDAWKKIQQDSASNVKRTLNWAGKKLDGTSGQSPYLIMDLQEIKTTWHPIQNIAGSGAAY